MTILWITNILFPEASAKITGVQNKHKNSGGWMLAAADGLIKDGEAQLNIATISPLVKTLTKISGENITYYVIPFARGGKKTYEDHWIQIKKEIDPDVVHIHGTELGYGYSYLKACGNKNVVVSIQGLVSVIAQYYYAGLSPMTFVKNTTLRDLLRGGSLVAQRDFCRRGVLEKEILRCVKHIIGRTSWDKAWATALNPCAEYHFCNEVLRNEFYDGSKWSYDKCRKHSIFLSQGSYPIKGLHQVLAALPLIRRHYPDVMVRIAGVDITNQSIRHATDYGKIIKNIIKRNNLEDNVVFIGGLGAEEMKQEYLSANVFVCPSSIENSPNSLGEAQMLGMPTVASYVGGVPDMMKGNEDNLYRFEEVGMLADKICRIFAQEERQVDMVNVAKERHDLDKNLEQLRKIYHIVANNQ